LWVLTEHKSWRGEWAVCPLSRLPTEYSGIPTTGYNRHFKFVKERGFLAPTLPEQTAIATVLSDMDAEIAALEAAATRPLAQAGHDAGVVDREDSLGMSERVLTRATLIAEIWRWSPIHRSVARIITAHWAGLYMPVRKRNHHKVVGTKGGASRLVPR